MTALHSNAKHRIPSPQGGDACACALDASPRFARREFPIG
jgi:hypothetical protein